ncbi:hypothetical protein F4810DRAFT_709527 [Camillea tinctor]|nr:hypothetical protein F4810DRAFT_709527 [Camillea tinctor]
MEVLGAIAATGQLVETAIRILKSISELRDYLKNAPAKYQTWHTELASLAGTISDIRDHSTLHTSRVGTIIESMAPKIDSLVDLCTRCTPEPKLRFVRRLNKALSARKVEACILQQFESLEHDKTTLILTISMLKREASRIITPPTPPPSVDLEPSDQEYNTDRPPEQSSQRREPGEMGPTNDTRAPESLPPRVDRTNPQGQRSSFKNLNVVGNNSMLGDGMGNGVDFEGVRVNGSQRIDGAHPVQAVHAFSQLLQNLPPAAFVPHDTAQNPQDMDARTRDQGHGGNNATNSTPMNNTTRNSDRGKERQPQAPNQSRARQSKRKDN